jgi:asparagine synthase (glutamine-hydrolysing)
MCGITGFARSGMATLPGEDADILGRMVRTLSRRGPDAEGRHISGCVAMGHRRLSIVDLANGKQPMVDAETGLVLVVNGEIYNFKDLNTELKTHGVYAHTRSDTETLLNAYKVWGPACVHKLNGMFSFVVQDPRRRILFAARDRMGKKPFYYSHQRGVFVFGSEAKALLPHPVIRAEIDPQAAARYFLHEFVPAPYSIFKGISKLAAGQCLTYHWDKDEVKVETFWDLYKYKRAVPDNATEEYWTERILEELESAVRRRLISDVPLGSFLSGGIDSSAVTAMMAKIMGPENVKTFSIGFNDKRFDESGHARRMAEHLGTQHHEELLSANVAMDILPKVVSVLDEPFADSSVLPTYLLARFARHHVTVALAGDGGDELFAGYDTFQALNVARLYNTVMPKFAHDHIMKPLTHLLPVSYGNFSFDFRVRQFLRGLKSTESQRLWRWLGSFVPEELDGLLESDSLSTVDTHSLYDGVEKLFDNVANRDAIDRDGYIFAKTYLADGVLTKVDRATMACSLEARSPLLDHDFIALVSEIPSRLKYRGGLSKYIMRKALRGILPDDILSRPKKGFGMPVGDWFRGKFRSMLLDTLHERRIRDGGILRPEKVNLLVEQHLSGKRDNRKPLWTLFMFEQWREHWMKQEAPQPEPELQLAAK